MPIPKQREIRIRDSRNQRLVTAIEVLSPSNKRSPGSYSHAYKLTGYWNASVNTVDIDLLRGGHHPYANRELQLQPKNSAEATYRVVSVTPPGDSAVWEFSLTDQLPTIPIPLLIYDKPIVLNLQRAFTDLYAYSTYPRREATELDQIRPALTDAEKDTLRKFL